MFAYECFYKDKRTTVTALRSIDAQEKAAKLFKARKQWEVTVVLAADQRGNPVTHSTASI
jgi:hypothetical protein